MAVEAIWREQVIAHSDRTVVVDCNHYFARAVVNPPVLAASATTSECPWKGAAHYCTLDLDGDGNEDAARYYSKPKREAEQVRDRIAFRHGVEVIEA